MHAVQLARVYLEIGQQNIDHRLGHIRCNLEPHHISEPSLPDTLLNGFKEIFCFKFLDCHFRIARYVERVGFNDLHPREQSIQICRDYLLQPDKVCFARRAALPGLFVTAIERNELRAEYWALSVVQTDPARLCPV